MARGFRSINKAKILIIRAVGSGDFMAGGMQNLPAMNNSWQKRQEAFCKEGRSTFLPPGWKNRRTVRRLQ